MCMQQGLGFGKQERSARAHDGAMCMNIDVVFLKHEHGVVKHLLDVQALGRQ